MIDENKVRQLCSEFKQQIKTSILNENLKVKIDIICNNIEFLLIILNVFLFRETSVVAQLLPVLDSRAHATCCKTKARNIKSENFEQINK